MRVDVVDALPLDQFVHLWQVYSVPVTLDPVYLHHSNQPDYQYVDWHAIAYCMEILEMLKISSVRRPMHVHGAAEMLRH